MTQHKDNPFITVDKTPLVTYLLNGLNWILYGLTLISLNMILNMSYMD